MRTAIDTLADTEANTQEDGLLERAGEVEGAEKDLNTGPEGPTTYEAEDVDFYSLRSRLYMFLNT